MTVASQEQYRIVANTNTILYTYGFDENSQLNWKKLCIRYMHGKSQKGNNANANVIPF